MQAAGLDRVQWAFVELMVVDLEEDGGFFLPSILCPWSSLVLPLGCCPSIYIAAQADLLWLTSSGVHGGLTVRVQGSGRELREGFGCMMT